MNQTPPRRSVAPVVFGLALTALFLAFIGYLASQRRAAEQQAASAMVLLSPVDGDVVRAPIELRFTTARPLVMGPGGWGDGRNHIHAWINGTEYMPAAADIRSEAGAYAWRIAGLPAGRTTVSLAWSDASHRRLPAATPPITVQIRK